MRASPKQKRFNQTKKTLLNCLNRIGTGVASVDPSHGSATKPLNLISKRWRDPLYRNAYNYTGEDNGRTFGDSRYSVWRFPTLAKDKATKDAMPSKYVLP
ncbi:hypothetical protein NPIL_636301 [Nephila pilipes]|uniref:Uncharacterized protein n=1 Tax=Nephila pilipes TaxID=299642 RepID=A0A8X6Q858_NEPPI|nr:hypothetical protein NPIL_636301 [Nephila pilipes]